MRQNVLTKEDCYILRKAWENIKQLKSLHIEFRQGMKMNENLTDIFSILLKRIQEIEELDIDFTFVFLGDQTDSIIGFCGIFLSNIINLKTLRLGFEGTKISKRSLKTLLKCIKGFSQKLIELELNLSDNEVTDNDILSLFDSMPHMETFALGLGKTQITDKTIENLSLALKDMKALKDLSLYIWEVNITAKKIFEILKNTLNLSRLKLYVTKVEVNDQLLIEFEKDLLPKMNNLKQLFFLFDKGITEEGRSLQNKLNRRFFYKRRK